MSGFWHNFWNSVTKKSMNTTYRKGWPETVKFSAQTNGPYKQAIVPKAIVLHHTDGAYSGSVDWTGRVIDPGTGKRLYASYHCIIARDGRRTVTNPDTNRAYHAGTSVFKGRASLNHWSLGVAWEGNTHQTPLSDAAIDSALEYMIPRMKKLGITPDWVTDHRTVAPKRKTDLAPDQLARFMDKLKAVWKAEK